MTIYLGPPGALAALPSLSSPTAPLGIKTAIHESLSGARTVDRIGTPRRTYTFSRAALTADEWGLLEALALGTYGFEPYVLVDPWRRNHLSLEVSTAGDPSRSANGFTLGTAVPGATKAVAWSDLETGSVAENALIQWNATALGQELFAGPHTAGAYSETYDTPVVRNLPYRFSARVTNATGSPTVQAIIRWFTYTGASAGADSSGSAVTVNTSFQDVFVQATAPATAAWARVFLGHLGGTAAATIYTDRWMLTQGSSAVSWVPGTGVARVTFTELGDTYRVGYEHDTSMTLVEVG